MAGVVILLSLAYIVRSLVLGWKGKFEEVDVELIEENDVELEVSDVKEEVEELDVEELDVEVAEQEGEVGVELNEDEDEEGPIPRTPVAGLRAEELETYLNSPAKMSTRSIHRNFNAN